MYYKIIVYEKKFTKLATKKGYKDIVYFDKKTTYHNIPKATLTKNYLETWAKWCDTKYHISSILETQQDDLIINHNKKVEKYKELFS